MKKCPACAEEIQDDATVCKHCGRDFNAQQALEARQAQGRKIWLGCAVVLLLGFVGCFVLFMGGSSAESLTEEDFVGSWPFTVSSGWLDCSVGVRTGRPMVTFQGGGDTYGLNGAAMSYGYPDGREIRKPGGNLSGIIQRGIAICNAKE